MYPRLNVVCGRRFSCPHHSHAPPFFRGLHGLTVHNGGARSRLALIRSPHFFSQGVVDAQPCAIASKTPEIPIDGLPRTVLLGQHPPRTSATNDVQDSIDNLTCARNSWPPTRFR